MKGIKIVIVAFAAALVSIGCDALRTVSSNEVVSQGAPYELIVVCEQPEWEGALGDTLRSVLTAPIPYLMQVEPMFDLLRVTARSYERLVARHRNILRCVIAPEMEETSVAVQYDIHSKPQIILTLQGPTEAALTEYVSQHAAQIVEVLERAERDRSIAYSKRFNVLSIEQTIRDKFGMEMKIPAGYMPRNEEPNFFWFSYEYPTSSQGVFIYSYAATKGAKSLAPAELLKARNKFAAMIPGPSEGSHMTTFADYEPDYRTFRLDGRLWVEMRGLWEVENDYMGGPFVSYSTINTNTGEVITIDGYVYSPKNPKRNYLRGVEHLLYSVDFPKAE